MIPETSAKKEQLLEHAIEFSTTKNYPSGFLKDKKCAVRRKGAALMVGNLNAEVFMKHHGRQVEIVTERNELE